MPLSKHIGKHVYGKDPNSQLVLKRSLQGDGPMKLEKINHEIRIRQEPMGTADGATKRSNRASLPPLQMQSERQGKRGKNQQNRQSSPGFQVDGASASPPAGSSQRRNKTAANSGGARTAHASLRQGSPSKKHEALLFQI